MMKAFITIEFRSRSNDLIKSIADDFDFSIGTFKKRGVFENGIELKRRGKHIATNTFYFSFRDYAVVESSSSKEKLLLKFKQGVTLILKLNLNQMKEVKQSIENPSDVMETKIIEEENKKSLLRTPLATINPNKMQYRQNICQISPGTIFKDILPTLKKRRLIDRDDSDFPKLKQPRPTTTLSIPRVTLQTLMSLSDCQQQVINIASRGESLFFTGAAGTGKSFTLKEIIKQIPKDGLHITASTGVAACNINGCTLHEWSSSGVSITNATALAKKVEGNKEIKKRWIRTKVLIIDEISMLDGNYFDCLEEAARLVRNSNKPFGGIQVILCGDFFQLPPVNKNEGTGNAIFCFESKSWNNVVTNQVELRVVFRQRNNLFIKALNEIRRGECTSETISTLNPSLNRILKSDDGICATELFTHKVDVDALNNKMLNNLKTESNTYEAIDSGSALYSSSLDKLTKKKIELKIGSQVVLNKSIRGNEGLVNGARGVVTKFTGSCNSPIIKFSNGLETVITRESWHIIIQGKQVASRSQIPLDLAWALSIHKSQGMSIERVSVDLSKVFEYGQSYVALSRATNLEGLSIKGNLSIQRIKAHPTLINELTYGVISSADKDLNVSFEEYARRMGIFGEIALRCDDGPSESMKALLLSTRCRIGPFSKREDISKVISWLDSGARKIIWQGDSSLLFETCSQLPKDRVACVISKDQFESEYEVLKTIACSLVIDFGHTFAAESLPSLNTDNIEIVIKAEKLNEEQIVLILKKGFSVQCNQISLSASSSSIQLGSVISLLTRSDRIDNLFTTVVVDRRGVALGLVYSSSESISIAIQEGRGVYYSRSRGGIWRKGESSGSTQTLLKIDLDCDNDALRFQVIQNGGGFCHLGDYDCWAIQGNRGLLHLQDVLHDRKVNAPENSYTSKLFKDENMLRHKLLEEAQELMEAREVDDIASECADVMYFAMVALVKGGATMDDVEKHLEMRSFKVTRRPGLVKEYRIIAAEKELRGDDSL